MCVRSKSVVTLLEYISTVHAVVVVNIVFDVENWIWYGWNDYLK